MMRQNLRRRNPKHSEVEIDKALLEWLQGESEPDKGGHPGRRRLRQSNRDSPREALIFDSRLAKRAIPAKVNIVAGVCCRCQVA